MSIERYQSQITKEYKNIENYQNTKTFIDRNIEQLESVLEKLKLITDTICFTAPLFSREGWIGINYNHYEEEGILNYVDGYRIYENELDDIRDKLKKKIKELEDNSNELSKSIKNANQSIKSLNHAIARLKKYRH